MDQTIACPACRAGITLKQLFRTGTLIRFKCPHCATKLRPKDRSFAVGWLAIAGVVGALTGIAAAMLFQIGPDGIARIVAAAGLVVLVAGALAVIKWRASMALIKKTELQIAP